MDRIIYAGEAYDIVDNMDAQEFFDEHFVAGFPSVSGSKVVLIDESARNDSGGQDYKISRNPGTKG